MQYCVKRITFLYVTLIKRNYLPCLLFKLMTFNEREENLVIKLHSIICAIYLITSMALSNVLLNVKLLIILIYLDFVCVCTQSRKFLMHFLFDLCQTDLLRKPYKKFHISKVPLKIYNIHLVNITESIYYVFREICIYSCLNNFKRVVSAIRLLLNKI